MPFDIPKHKQNPITLIRTASSHELSSYEKAKLANIEEDAQENKIESIKINDKRLQIDADNKEVNITLGELAFRDNIDTELSSCIRANEDTLWVDDTAVIFNCGGAIEDSPID